MKNEPEYIPDLLKNKPEQIFTVPQDYFKHFSESLEVNIESKMLAEIKGLNSNPFKVPASYFEESLVQITQLTCIKKDTLQVPTAYFETLSSKILSRIELQNKPVVKTSIFTRTWMYSAAAMLILCVSLFLIQLNKQGAEELNLSSIEEDALLDYVFENTSEYDAVKLMETFNTNELNVFKIDEPMNDESIDELIQEYQ